ncbi:MAG: hypothetical protein NZ959_04075 [Armatimonadetes bacterium]|nr:hypothetical protein [Armatimonadota bacterium]MDW8122561.1 hypothetical protein [Armatimonadota bacterium]
MKGLRVTLLICLMALISGCARVQVSTVVERDGTWSRSLTFRGAPIPFPQGVSAAEVTGPTLKNQFRLPQGSGWKTRSEKEEGMEILVFERRWETGDTVSEDLVIKNPQKGDNSKLLVNEVRVGPVSKTRFAYEERLKWVGPSPVDLMPEKAIVDQVAAALPAHLATKDNMDKLINSIWSRFLRSVMGPDDLLMAYLFVHPDFGERQLRQRLYPIVLDACRQLFKDKISEEHIRKVAQILSDIKPQAKAGAAVKTDLIKQDSQSDFPVLLFFSVRLPGKIIETNGQIDPTTGEVWWGCFSLAVALEDLRLFALSEVPRE